MGSTPRDAWNYVVLVGHFAVSFLGKRAEPRLSLGSLMLAAMLADVLWCVFMLVGIESIQLKPGMIITAKTRAIDALEPSNIVFSHSLLMLAVWSAVMGVLVFAFRRVSRSAAILFAVSLSHWFLDVVSHPPDMPLAPGLAARLGLGLWNSVPATVSIEGGLWLIAIAVLVRAGVPVKRWRRYSFWAGVVLLTVIWLGNITGPVPE